MYAGMMAPIMTVVMKTMNSTLHFIMFTRYWSSGFSGVRLRIRAKATEPRIIPANHTMPSSYKFTFHVFFMNRRYIMPERTKILTNREMAQTII